jgi:hypothetical protein
MATGLGRRGTSSDQPPLGGGEEVKGPGAVRLELPEASRVTSGLDHQDGHHQAEGWPMFAINEVALSSSESQVEESLSTTTVTQGGCQVRPLSLR